MYKNRGLIGALILAYMIIPFLAPENIIHLMTISGVWIIIAYGLNLLTGYMGYVSFGHAGFMGIGAYTAALLAKHLGFSFWVSVIIASFLTGIIGFLIGKAILRLSGIYFSIGTLILGEILYSTFYNWSSVTGGFMGLIVPGVTITISRHNNIPFQLTHWYYLVHFVLIAVVGLTMILVRSQFGKELIAIRENESLAESLGVNVNLRKSQCFAIACSFAGLGGVLYAYYMHHIDPGSFAMAGSTQFITVIIIGGLASLIGPFLGTYLLISLSLYLELLGSWRMVAYGIIIVVVMLYARDGIAGSFKKLINRMSINEITSSKQY